MDPEVQKWEPKIREPRKWLLEDRYVTWVLPYHDMTLLITKISEVGGTLVTVEKTHGGEVWAEFWLESHTPEALLEVLHREVPLVLVKIIQVS